MFEKTVRDQMLKLIKYIQAIDYDNATDLTQAVFQQMEADFLPAPLIILHSPVPQIMAGAWSILRESLLAGAVNRSHKETVAITVSKMNECPFCVDAHTVMLRATSNHDVADAIPSGDFDSIQHPELRQLVNWVLAHRIASADVEPAPFAPSATPEMIGTIITFHYLNRMANIFLGDSFLPLPSAVKGITLRLYAATAGKQVVRNLPQGNSLKFLADADLPDDLLWASANPAVAKAFAAFAKVIDDVGVTYVPEPVRELISERVQAWHGEPMSISRQWVEEAIAGFQNEHKVSARLALLTALASYQVDATVIQNFQIKYPEDAALIATTAWASFTGARRVGQWVANATNQAQVINHK